MATLITVAEVNDRLRLGMDVYDAGGDPLDPEDIDSEDLPRVLAAMDEAESTVLDYIDQRDENFGTSPPSYSAQQLDVIKGAILLLIQAALDDPDGRTAGDYMKTNTGAVPLLLMRLRRPTVA